ncbi:ABC transporter permease [Haloarcula pelagica]|uniref:ABC transporter permease n=1 Tax=Haloarcula pelagica TaxID=3033389 RepID=UPI0024C3840C|nr:ABC transporter permease subunit [Halomicroarcula sp. YJ-61-S]
MRWFPLARKECRTILTSKGSWALVVLVVLWGYRPTYVGWDGLGPDLTIAFVQYVALVIPPLGILLLSFQSIVGERTAGSLKFVLGLPLTRTDILTGKVVGRAAGIGGAVLLGIVLLTGVGLVRFGSFDVLTYGGVVLVTLLYVAVLVSVGVAISAVSTTAVRATGALVGGFFLPFVLFWSLLANTIYGQLTGQPVNPYDPPASGPLFLLHRLSPTGAYNVVTNWLLGVGNSAAPYTSVLTKRAPGSNINALVVETTFDAGAIPFYLQEWVAVLVLLVWLLGPLGLARYAFERGDLV